MSTPQDQIVGWVNWKLEGQWPVYASDPLATEYPNMTEDELAELTGLDEYMDAEFSEHQFEARS